MQRFTHLQVVVQAVHTHLSDCDRVNGLPEKETLEFEVLCGSVYQNLMIVKQIRVRTYVCWQVGCANTKEPTRDEISI